MVARYATRLQRFLRMHATHDDVDDLLQETFLLCWQKRALYDPSRPFAPWLFKLGVNVAATRARRARALEPTELDELPGGSDPAAIACEHDARANLWDVVQRTLAPDARTALWLFYGEDQSAAAIGDILGKSEGAVRVLLFRARAALQATLEPHLPMARAR